MRNEDENEVRPLSSYRAGEAARVVRVEAGRGLKQRLMALGLVPGTEVYILNADWGPMTLCVNNSRVALGRGMAAKIYAVPMPAPCPTCGAPGPCDHKDKGES